MIRSSASYLKHAVKNDIKWVDKRSCIARSGGINTDIGCRLENLGTDRNVSEKLGTGVESPPPATDSPRLPSRRNCCAEENTPEPRGFPVLDKGVDSRKGDGDNDAAVFKVGIFPVSMYSALFRLPPPNDAKL